jgi:putative ABC transport system substrate-binding protein
MKRREFLSVLGGAAATWPVVARAQQPRKLPAVGVLNSGAAAPFAKMITAFQESLEKNGYVDGRTVRIELRWANGQYDKLPELAAELVRIPVDVLAAPGGDIAGMAAKVATSSIPIVFMVGRDPTKSGLVESLSRPGGNATGVNILTLELAAKRMELLRDLLPARGPIGVLVNPDNANAETDADDVREAAHKIAQATSLVAARNPDEIDDAFAKFVQQKVMAVLVVSDPYYLSRREQFAALELRYALPAIFSLREHAVAGGLLSYGPNLIEAYRQVGDIVGRILKGTRPSDIPVEQPTKFELVVNQITAKALALKIPESFLLRADEVIE